MSKFFQKIGTAISDSPRLENNIAEAYRFRKLFDSELIFVHVGNKTDHKVKLFNDTIAAHNDTDETPKIVWKKTQPVAGILRFCEEENIDLLIAGAIKDETLLRYYLGSVARELSRKAPCSLLLLTNPQIKFKTYEKMVCSMNKNDFAQTVADLSWELAQDLQVSQLHFIEEMAPKRLKARPEDSISQIKNEHERYLLTTNEIRWMNTLLEPLPEVESLEVFCRVVFGKKGHLATHYSQNVDSDLLILEKNTKNKHFTKIFRNPLEYVLSDMPSDVLLLDEKHTQ